MTHIIAIGGGEIGRQGYPIETTEIDEQIIVLSGKKKPNVLFLPTASNDNSAYSQVFKKHYAEHLGSKVDVLDLWSKPTKASVKTALANADIIYVGGGNTLKMMTLWRRTGVDELLTEAYQNGTILTGVSAGAICWFWAGLSDSRSYTSKGKTWDYVKVRGLNIKNLLICPHYDAEPKRRPALKNSLKGSARTAIALDNCAALDIKDDMFRILSSKRGAIAHKAYWKNGRYFVDDIVPGSDYAPLTDLTD
jgi:dipeptidase E